MGLSRLALSLVGLWPKVYESPNRKILENLRICVILNLILYFVLIPTMWSLLRVRHDFVLIIDNLQISFPMTSALLKWSILWWRQDDISEVLNEVKSDWLKVKDVEKAATMIKCARIARRITITGYCLIISLLLILDIPPCFGFSMRYVTNFTDPGGPFPVQSYFFYDVTKRSYFRMTYVFQSISLAFMGVCYTAIDCFFALLILHVCGQLENLASYLTNLCRFKNVRVGLSYCVNEHERLIRLIRIIDDTVNVMQLVQLLIFIILFCFQGFLFVKVIKEGGDLSILRFIWLVGAILTLLVHMLVYCIIGEILAMRCEEVHGAAYNCDWYTLEPSDARMLMLVLIRARTPLYLTAGKMFPMTMDMFCNVFKTSISYVSVLLAYS